MLTSKQAERIANNAMQTRFTWAVIFLAFIAGLLGLLPAVQPEESIYFFGVIGLTYFSLICGLSYSLFAICKTTYVIEYLIEEYEEQQVKTFLKNRWHVFYSGFLRDEKGEFREIRTILCSIGVAIPWILLFVLKFL